MLPSISPIRSIDYLLISSNLKRHLDLRQLRPYPDMERNRNCWFAQPQPARLEQPFDYSQFSKHHLV
jgi:hypothetical protein